MTDSDSIRARLEDLARIFAADLWEVFERELPAEREAREAEQDRNKLGLEGSQLRRGVVESESRILALEAAEREREAAERERGEEALWRIAAKDCSAAHVALDKIVSRTKAVPSKDGSRTEDISRGLEERVQEIVSEIIFLRLKADKLEAVLTRLHAYFSDPRHERPEFKRLIETVLPK